MPSPEFFASCGVFVDRHALDAASCASLAAEACAAQAARAMIYTGADFALNEQSRRTAIAEVGTDSRAVIESLLQRITPRLEAHFHLSLRAHQPTEFLVYRPGDFFEIHEDGGTTADPDSPQLVKDRRISVVLFLNADFTGGALTIYNLLADARARAFGFPLQPEPGLLVAFRSETPHEVTPVASGERVSVVTFFT